MNAQHVLILLAIPIVLGLASNAAEPSEPARDRVFYVRQTIGDDANDGLSPQTAWRSLSKLEEVMRAKQLGSESSARVTLWHLTLTPFGPQFEKTSKSEISEH